ncbi:MAG TPA: TraR/DksA family transcriptional regulator [Bryobacteraceae bacterium]|nr:TraR/DksA family transcriptional regulator [Bryobacteraceae bacterium]
MNKQSRSLEAPPSNEIYHRMLIEKRDQFVLGLGSKFDTIASLGRVAEDDQAQLSHDEFVSLRLNSLDYGQLRLVEEALDRFRSGDYGVCLSCENPIPPKRLHAVPWARYCVQCQEALGTDREELLQEVRPRP